MKHYYLRYLNSFSSTTACYLLRWDKHFCFWRYRTSFRQRWLSPLRKI